MQLISFQIKECFGFRDSSRIDLYDPTNLIYILGRNSAGKTSFLTALAHFNRSLNPQEHQNSQNFDPSSLLPLLLCEYEVKAGDFSIEVFQKDFARIVINLNQGNQSLTTRNEYKLIIDNLTNEIGKLYNGIIHEIEIKGNLWACRNGSGKYQFSTKSDFNAASDRIAKNIPLLYNRILQEANQPGAIANKQLQFPGNSPQPFHLPTPDEIESLLAYQLPLIVWFDKKYSLLDTLPDIIKIEHLKQSPNVLTTSLIDYLGRSQLERLLRGQNPRERNIILIEIQKKINLLLDEVNKNRPAGTELLTIDLSRVDGIQITVIAGNKSSFYRHLSDNTKLLFAYHLYANVNNLSGNILLFDEPNNGFHATAQERLLKFLQNLGERGNLVILSTHSEHLVDPDHLTSVRLMTADDNGYLHVRNKWYAVTRGNGDFLALRPILDAIGLRYGANQLTICDKVIVTEGVTELLYLRAFRQLLGYGDELHIAPATGDDTILNVVSLLISQGLRFKTLVDITTISAGHKSIKEKLQERFDIPNESIYEVAVPLGFPRAKGSGIEDVFSKVDFAKLLANTDNTPMDDFEVLSNSEYMNRKKPGIVPKRVVAHEFNKCICKFSKDDFEEKTLENIRQMLDFCMNGSWFFL